MTLPHSPPEPAAAARLADEVEALASADLHAAGPASLAQQLGITARRHADATLLLAPGLPSPMFNRVIGLGVGTPATEGDLDALSAIYRDAGVPSWWLHWNPYAAPADMPARLEARGFALAKRRAWAKFVRDAAPPPHVDTDLTVRPARAEEVATTATAIAAAFQMPLPIASWIEALYGRARWRMYCVAEGDRPAGGGCVFIDGDRAWLGLGGVAGESSQPRRPEGVAGASHQRRHRSRCATPHHRDRSRWAKRRTLR